MKLIRNRHLTNMFGHWSVIIYHLSTDFSLIPVDQWQVSSIHYNLVGHWQAAACLWTTQLSPLFTYRLVFDKWRLVSDQPSWFSTSDKFWPTLLVFSQLFLTIPVGFWQVRTPLWTRFSTASKELSVTNTVGHRQVRTSLWSTRLITDK